MKPEGHLDKARAFEDRAGRWDSERDAPSVIEGIFDAAVHYIAYAVNLKYGTDIDVHAAQKRFLKEHEEGAILQTFEEIEHMRVSSVYGGGWNGERIEMAVKLLGKVKVWAKITGK